MPHPLDFGRDHRTAWKAYLVHDLPAAYTQVKNFLLAVYAEGRGGEEDDNENAPGRLATVTCTLTAKEINDTLTNFGSLAAEPADPTATKVKPSRTEENEISSRMRGATETTSW